MSTKTQETDEQIKPDYSNDVMREITGIDKNEEAKIDSRANKDNQEQNAGAADNLLNQEQQASSGQQPSLTDEAKSLFKPGDSSRLLKTAKFMLLNRKGNALGAAFIFIGIFIAFMVLVGTGPAQLMHAAEWLKKINFTDQEIDADIRLRNLSIYSDIVRTGNLDGLQNTRLGVMSSKFIPRLDTQLKNRGITSKFEAGKLTGYQFDVDSITDDSDFKDLKDIDNPDDLKKRLANKLDIDVNSINDDLFIETKGTRNTRLINKVMASAAFPKTKFNLPRASTMMSFRIMNLRGNVSFNPKTRLAEFLKTRVATTYVAAADALRDARSKDISSNTDIDIDTTNKRDVSEGDINEDTRKIDASRSEFKDIIDTRDSTKLNALRGKITTIASSSAAAATTAALAILGIMCGAKDISAGVADANLSNLMATFIRAAADVTSTNSKMREGNDVDAGGIGVASENFNGNDSSWIQASSLQYESTGVLEGERTFDDPDLSELSPESDGIFEAVDGWFDELSGFAGFTVDAICTTFNWFGSLADAVLQKITFGISTKISTWISEKLMSFLVNGTVDVMNAVYHGEAYGEIIALGARMYANSTYQTKGARALTAEEEIDKRNIKISYLSEQKSNIFERVVDLDNPYSPISKVYASTADKSWTENIANIPNLLANGLSSLFGGKVGAQIAPTEVYYGIPATGFTKVEENPYEVAAWVANNVTDEDKELFYTCHKTTVTEDFNFISDPQAYINYASLPEACNNDNNQGLNMLRQLAGYTDAMESGVGCYGLEDDEACKGVYGIYENTAATTTTTTDSTVGSGNWYHPNGDNTGHGWEYWNYSPYGIGTSPKVHGGIDFYNSYGKVYAACDGTVKRVQKGTIDDKSLPFITEEWTSSNFVVISCGSSYGPYEMGYHHTYASVSEGDSVMAGDVVGTTDNSGTSFGAHLHFAVKDTTKLNNGYLGFVNPTDIIKEPALY